MSRPSCGASASATSQSAFSSDSILVTVQQTGATLGACFVYARLGQNPSMFSYNYRNISMASTVTLTIPNPSDDTYCKRPALVPLA